MNGIRRTNRAGRTIILPVLCILVAAARTGAAEGTSRAGDEENLAERSLPLRTTLHRDPTMAAPFDRLLDLYRNAGRTDELIEVYESHLARYPNDVRALTILVRIMKATGSPDAAGAARKACGRHPDDAYLRFLHYEALRSNHDPDALAELDRAIEIEKLPRRKREWIDVLLPEAAAVDRRDLAEKHLRGLASLAGGTPEGRLGVARQMIMFGFFNAALEVLQARSEAGPPASPGTMVETELAAASAEAGLGLTEEAGARLERLLSKLTADYWQRPAILRRRIALVSSDAEREAMIGAARERVAEENARHPNHEAAVLDLAELLSGFERRRDALDVLLKAGQLASGSAGARQPAGQLGASVRIEKAILDLFDRLRDERGREKYLAERIREHPDRQDLVLARISSFFLLGRRKEAASAFEALVEAMQPEERFDRLLEMARFLRRSNLSAEAAEVFRWAVALAPSRLDVRRELAETYLAQGLRARAADLFSGLGADGFAPGAETEHLLDIVQFMIGQELYRQAKAALVRAAREDETNLEIRTLLLTVHGRLADRAAGEELVVASRRLADTPSRYRLWLESAVAFHDTFDSVEAFLDKERARLDLEHGEWTAARLERSLAFADCAARDGCTDVAVGLIEGCLAGEIPSEMGIKLRRRLVGILEKEAERAARLTPSWPASFGQRHGPVQAAALSSPESDRVGAVVHELERLIEDDPRHADEYNARLALLYSKNNRFDIAYPLAEKVNIDALADPVLLSRLETLHRQRGGGRKAMRILERLTALDPTNRGNWERWLSALAKAGDERRLRSGVLRLLAGIDRMPLAEETQVLLRSHLADSYWRSIAEMIASGSAVELSQALALVDSVERTSGGPDEFLWTTWTRAYLLNRLDRLDERDEAIGELERVAGELSAEPDADPDSEGTRVVPPGQERPGPSGITFPDGLTVSLEGARRLLTRAPEREETLPVRPDRRAAAPPPLGEPDVRWAFDTTAGAPVTAILPLDDTRTLISDLRGRLYCLDSLTGKLLWEREGALPPTPARATGSNWYVSHGRSSYMDPPVPPRPLALGGELILVPGRGAVECLAAGTGRLVWRAEIGEAPAGRSFVSAFVRDERVLAFDPVSCRVASLDRATGKLIWEKELGENGTLPGILSSSQSVGWLNSGASLFGDRLLVYGSRSAIVDAETGEVEWSFEPARVRRFPLRLKEPESRSPGGAGLRRAGAASAAQAGAGPLSAALQWLQASQTAASRWGRTYQSHSIGSGFVLGMPPQYVNYLAAQRARQTYPRHGTPSGTVLAAPAVVWAAGSQGQPRLGVLRDGRLLLFNQQNLLVLDLDLPLKARSISVSGTFVGLTGRVAVLLQQNQLVLADLSSGDTKTYGLQEVTGGQANVHVGACVDGPHVYVTGPGGILCVNARATLRVAHSAWPELVAPDKRVGMTAPRGLSFVLSATRPNSTQYHLQGTLSGFANGYGPCMPMVERVGEGVLYATPAPWRVVALEERAVGADAEDW